MTPAARVQAAIEVIDAWQDGRDGLDKVLARWARAHRFAGSGDRAAIADHVYATVRRLRSAGWVSAAHSPTGRDLLRGNLILDGADPAQIFTGDRHAPAALAPSEGDTRALADAPRAVRLDYPDWLEPYVEDVPDALLAALRSRAPLDLRVNTLKTDPPGAVDALAQQGITALPLPISPTSLRVTDGARKVARSEAYTSGRVEIQDAASQAVSAMAGAQPGMTVLDLCAGGGGKTLAMAAAMQNRGRLIAHDIAPARLADLAPRATRAGAKIDVVRTEDLNDLQSGCDLVLIDAPCSGSGAWRRNPDAKWRLTQNRLDQLTATQADLMDQAVSLTAENGRIAYVTCSIFAAENRAIADRFIDKAPNYRLVETTAFTPLNETDGFFCAVFQRN